MEEEELFRSFCCLIVSQSAPTFWGDCCAGGEINSAVLLLVGLPHAHHKTHNKVKDNRKVGETRGGGCGLSPSPD